MLQNYGKAGTYFNDSHLMRTEDHAVIKYSVEPYQDRKLDTGQDSYAETKIAET